MAKTTLSWRQGVLEVERRSSPCTAAVVSIDLPGGQVDAEGMSREVTTCRRHKWPNRAAI